MKVLIDTCVWSLLLRRRDQTLLNSAEKLLVASLEELISDGRVAIIGPVRQEVLSGVKEAVQFETLRKALRRFPDEPLGSSDFEEAARLSNICRSRGAECGATDILICAVAIRERWTVMTNDAGMLKCMAVLKSQGVM
jgi:predicted nucleic acid-binding protein